MGCEEEVADEINTRLTRGLFWGVRGSLEDAWPDTFVLRGFPAKRLREERNRWRAKNDDDGNRKAKKKQREGCS